MKKRQIRAVIKKDIMAVASSFQLWLPMLLLPVVFSLVMPSLLILPAYKYDISERSILEVLDDLPPGELRETIFSFDSTNKQMVYFGVHYLFAPFLLIIPLMAASVLGSGSFAREKERKTMESLLLAPISAFDLFWAKILASFIPAVLLAFISFLLYGTIVNLTAYRLFGGLIFPRPHWLILLFWVSPALSLGAVFLNVFISAKVKGFQEAYQLGALTVLPLIALIAGQITGVLLLSNTVLWLLGAGLWLLDLLLIKRSGRYLDRSKLFATLAS
ncbi:MAG: ABC transporter permease [Firmicutes bacterium]|nr:ABC transporter permease [Bacillota bacterium]